MSSDGLFGEFTYAYVGQPLAIVASAMFGQKDYDAPNPVYGRRLDSDHFGFTGTVRSSQGVGAGVKRLVRDRRNRDIDLNVPV